MKRKINIDTGEGITLNGNKLTVSIDEDNGLIKKNDDGIYVPSLKGEDGADEGSIVDGVTITDTEGALPLGLNYDNVMLIFSMCAFKISSHMWIDGILPVTGRTASDVKRISDIVSEMNYDTNGSVTTTQYIMRPHDLFMFKGLANARKCTHNANYSEDGNRYVGSIPHALFTVNSASYTGSHCNHLSLTCIWVDSNSVVNSVVSVGDVWSI